MSEIPRSGWSQPPDPKPIAPLTLNPGSGPSTVVKRRGGKIAKVVLVVVALVVVVVALAVVMVKSVSGAFGRKFAPIDFGLGAAALWLGPWSGLCVQIYTHIYTHMHTYMYICMCVCACIYAYVYMHVYLHTCVYIHVYVYLFICASSASFDFASAIALACRPKNNQNRPILIVFVQNRPCGAVRL